MRLDSRRKKNGKGKKPSYIYHISPSMHFNGQKLFTHTTVLEHSKCMRYGKSWCNYDFRFAPATKRMEVSQDSQVTLKTGQQ